MVGYLSKGSLRTSIADFVEAHPGGVTWNQVKANITIVFLAEDEAEHQRSNIEGLRQQPYQDSREYGLKFMAAVQKANSQAELQVPLVMERLVKLFIGDWEIGIQGLRYTLLDQRTWRTLSPELMMWLGQCQWLNVTAVWKKRWRLHRYPLKLHLRRKTSAGLYSRNCPAASKDCRSRLDVLRRADKRSPKGDSNLDDGS